MPDSGLLGFAGQTFILSVEIEGSTQREHLMSEWRQDGYNPDLMPQELDTIDPPDCLLYLWNYFLDMGSRRQSNGYHDMPLPHAEVVAWERRRGVHLLPFENDLIDKLDALFVKVQTKLAAEKAKK